MNTIPTTFKRVRVPYTVVGGRRAETARKYPMALSILVLKRAGNPFRSEVLTRLERLSVDEIISVEGPSMSYDVEGLAKRFPSVKFLILHAAATPGEQVNIGIEESGGRLVFTIWDDMVISPSGVNQKLIGSLMENECICTVPLLQNQKAETVPSISAPAFYRKLLRVIALPPSSDREFSLYPFDYSGIYMRERFMLVGGYDYGLSNPYWQKLDFGFRSYMWGESIRTSTTLRVAYQDDVPADDTTPDESYKIFYLKNLCVRFSGDSGCIPVSRFFGYLFRSGGDPVSAYREFSEVRRWVSINRYRCTRDARSITELW